jgi:hypothetical protein
VGLVAFFLAASIGSLLNLAYGQDIDPSYYCMTNEYPFRQMCEKLEIEEIMNQLLERAQEWNLKK